MTQTRKMNNLDKFLGIKTIKIPKRNRYISKKLKNLVDIKCDNKCTECGSVENLQYDHIIPFSDNGETTLDNLQLLCEKHNKEKYNKFGKCLKCGENWVYKKYLYCYDCYINSMCE